MSRKRTETFYCFSPPVMLATFAIEIFFAFYTIWRYRLNEKSRLVVAVLLCLATFQGTEYLLCGGMGVDAGTWSKIGYGAITFLPPLGLHLAFAIAGKKSRLLVPAAYATCAMFLVYFFLATNSVSGNTCYANYVVFHGDSAVASIVYGFYYYGWLIAGIVSCLSLANKTTKNALYSLTAGYISFMAPTTAVNIIDPSTISGIPSIMCGFAVILAFILSLRVAPQSIERRTASEQLLRFKLPF